MNKRLHALPTLLITSFVLASTHPVLADPGQDQGLPAGAQQLVPMQPTMATPANYYPAQTGGPPQGYPPQGTPAQSGYPQQYSGQAYPQQGYPQQAQPYAAGVTEAVPGQNQPAPGQMQQPPAQMQQASSQMPPQQPFQQSYQQSPSPYEMQEQAIQNGHSQNRNELDKYSPPPDVPDAAPNQGYQGEVSKGAGMKGVVGKAASILKRTTQVAAPYAASFLVTTAAYKMANRNNGYNNGYGGYGGYGGGYGGYGMPMGGYGMPMGGMMPGMGMYGMPGMGMGMPIRMPGF